MAEKLFLTNANVRRAAIALVPALKLTDAPVSLYGVPRGGIPAAYALCAEIPTHARVVDNPREADVIVDDLIDSGATMERYQREFPNAQFVALFDKRIFRTQGVPDPWYVFPWERTIDGSDESFTDNVTRLLQYVGDNPARGGLTETPARVAKAWKFWCSGYGKDPKQILKVFEDGAEKHNQMVTVTGIPVYSHCEHHLAPIFGTATVSYIPNGKIVGLSKLSRLVDMFARRLQVQERLTDEVADALHDNLEPLGTGVCIKARHMCMESRGICQQGHHTITTALRGVMLDQPAARAEFMRQV